MRRRPRTWRIRAIDREARTKQMRRWKENETKTEAERNCFGERERERDRQTDREKDIHRDRETDRDRQRHRQIQREEGYERNLESDT